MNDETKPVTSTEEERSANKTVLIVIIVLIVLAVIFAVTRPKETGQVENTDTATSTVSTATSTDSTNGVGTSTSTGAEEEQRPRILNRTFNIGAKSATFVDGVYVDEANKCTFTIDKEHIAFGDATGDGKIETAAVVNTDCVTSRSSLLVLVMQDGSSLSTVLNPQANVKVEEMHIRELTIQLEADKMHYFKVLDGQIKESFVL